MTKLQVVCDLFVWQRLVWQRFIWLPLIAGPNCDDLRVHAFYWVSTALSGERMNTGDEQELKVDLKKCDWPRRSRICVVTFQSFVDSTY